MKTAHCIWFYGSRVLGFWRTPLRKHDASGPPDGHGGSSRQPQTVRGARGRRGKFQVVGAPEGPPHAVPRQLRVGRHEPLYALAGGVDRDGPRLSQPLHHLPIDVRHEVAEAIDAAGQRIERLVATYAELPGDGVGALFGSTDHLELDAPSSSAAHRLGLTRGAAVTVRRA